MLFYRKTAKIDKYEKGTPYAFLSKNNKNWQIWKEYFYVFVSNQIFLKNELNFGCVSFGLGFGLGLAISSSGFGAGGAMSNSGFSSLDFNFFAGGSSSENDVFRFKGACACSSNWAISTRSSSSFCLASLRWWTCSKAHFIPIFSPVGSLFSAGPVRKTPQNVFYQMF